MSFKVNMISCPHCGAQYHPSEIYMPNAFLGKPDDLVKDALGKVIYEDYLEEPNFVEHYTCDVCEKQFAVTASVTYKSAAETPEADFSTPYVSLF